MHLASHDNTTPDAPQPVRAYVAATVRRHTSAAMSAAGMGWAAWSHPGIAVPVVIALVTYTILA